MNARANRSTGADEAEGTDDAAQPALLLAELSRTR